MILSAGVALATIGAFAQAPGATAMPAETAVRAAVIDRLAADARLQGQVHVVVTGNIATLTGTVTDPSQVKWAEEDALSVDGVMQVTNLVRADIQIF
jgi:osmotically-inducible protein OsmY